MASARLPMDQLGAIENQGAVRFGILLPWVSALDGWSVTVKIIHERDQFRQAVTPREFALSHALLNPHGDYWSVTVPIAGPAQPDTSWGQPGRYAYRYAVSNADGRYFDWVVDPYAREFGLGKLSALTLGYEPYTWSANESTWRTPRLEDLVVYEINLAEFAGDLQRLEILLEYLADLGVNAIELMPLSNVALSVDWGYLPIGYFGVDERFGKRKDLQALVDRAHQSGIAVLFDMVYGHTGVDFAYYDLYTRLAYHENPFMGPFAKDLFSDFGKSTDFNRPLTRDYFFSVNLYWLEVFHADGIRYDCVPNYWNGPLGNGYSNLVYETHQQVRRGLALGDEHYTRFAGAAAEPLRLVQCAEQLEDPIKILNETYSNCTWQNATFDAAKAVARGARDRLTDLGLRLGLADYPSEATSNGDRISKTAFQYIENHDHERFICNFGTYNPDEAQNPLFARGDRGRWFKLQPYLIALLTAKGIPMLWAGQELCENDALPDYGAGRVGLLRPVEWDNFYDAPGRGTLTLIRKLLRLRRQREELRRGEHFFFNDWVRYQSLGVLLHARWNAAAYTLITVNVTDADVTVPFWFPIAGEYREQLHGGAGNLAGVVTNAPAWLTIPSNYGRIWTHVND